MTQFFARLILGLGVVLLAACASPHMSGELAAGKMAFQSGNYQKAFHELLPVAKAGRPEAQYAIGYMYYYGYGTPRDVTLGTFWIKRAAAQNYLMARQALERIDREEGTVKSPPPRTYSYKAETFSGRVITHPKPHHRAAPACLASGRYVLQLYGSYEFASTLHFQKRLQNNTQICQTMRAGKPWYIVVKGHYPTLVAAEQSKLQLSGELKKLHPWVRSTEGLQRA